MSSAGFFVPGIVVVFLSRKRRIVFGDGRFAVDDYEIPFSQSTWTRRLNDLSRIENRHETDFDPELIFFDDKGGTDAFSRPVYFLQKIKERAF